MRDDEAAGALGVSLGTFTHDELTRDGLDLADAGSLTDVVNLSVLLDDAAQTEQAQVVMEAAAEEARRRQLAGWFGTGTNIALLASGVGAAWRSAASAAIRTITDGLDDVEPARFEGASIAARQYEQIWRSAMANALERPATRQAAQRDPAVHAQVEEFRRRLDEIEACDDPFERSVLVSDLRTATEGTIVDDYMDRVVASNGLESIR
jgi:hypothetical protein